MKRNCFASILLLSAAQVLGQSSSNARELILHAGDPLFAAKSRTLEGRGSTVPEKGPRREWTFVVHSSVDGRVRRDTTTVRKVGAVETNSDIIQVFDGTDVWIHYSASKDYIKNPAGSHVPRVMEWLQLEYGRRAELLTDAAILRTEELPFGNGRALCDVVQGTYREGDKTLERVVWIAKQGNLILRDSWKPESPVPGFQGFTTVDYTTIDAETPLADVAFVFMPPDGSHFRTPGNAIARLGTPGAGLAAVVPTHTETAEYTPEARAARLQGQVALALEVTPQGGVKSVEIRRGLGLGLDALAVAAAKQWRYEPSTDDKPVTRIIQIPFRLQPPAVWDLDGINVNPQWGQGSHGAAMKPTLREYVPPEESACSAPGYVVFGLLVEADGTPYDVKIVQTFDEKAGAAVAAAVNNWRFRPAQIGNERRPARGTMVMRCRPAGDSVDPNAQVLRIGGGVTPPKVLYKVDPNYSEPARKAKFNGTALLQLVVEPDGTASHIRVIKQLGLGLDEEAMDAVRQWRFVPGKQAGKPVPVYATVEINFRLL
jgi:TonB family protein